MRFLLLLALGLIFIQSASAQNIPFGKPATKNPTPAQMDESFALYDQCEATDMIKKYYSCDCLAQNFLDLRTARPNDERDNLIFAARRKCPNTVDIAGESYTRCLSWAPEVRDDYQEYCGCYANAFATSFSARPTDSIRGREFIMTNALTSCNTGDEIAQKRARQNMIDQLKKQGVYESLFPNAKKATSPELDQSPN